MNSLRRVAARPAPTTEADQVRKVFHPFPSKCGDGRSGLSPASADLLLRLLAEVVNGDLRGRVVPGPAGLSPELLPSESSGYQPSYCTAHQLHL